MKSVKIKSPTRVDLAGGTLDCWPLYLFLDNPVTINVGIDIFTEVELKARPGHEITLETKDLGVTKKYTDIKSCLADTEPAFDLVRAVIRHFHPTAGFELTTRSESPIGGGLGGSSSLCISLLRAFLQWMGESIETHDLVRLASHLEARVLQKPTGTQDYYPALAGGLNVITYQAGTPKFKSVEVPVDIFADRFLLIYTGKSHHSGINNWQVIKEWLDGNQSTRAALSDLSMVSKKLLVAIEEKRLWDFADLFAQEFEARVRLSKGFSSPEIDRLAQIAKSEGAVAKICGAGGGGCVMIWCSNGEREKVRQKCLDEGFQVLNAQPWSAPQ
jgi:D-glycero-alpha-D-manno-heptose-7-phosphate kinase